MNKTLIIAEAGLNHNGDLGLAKELVDVAKEAGADIVKFQTVIPENLISKSAKKAEYQKETTGGDESQLDMVRKIMLPYEDFVTLKEYCDQTGIEFLSTPFDLDSIDFLNPLVKLWKIPSGEITNLPYLERIGTLGKPVIMSTGMSDIAEIRAAVDILTRAGTTDITILHCNTQYPTPFNDVNLNAMKSLQEEFGYPVGYSDHTLGIEVPIAAVAMGATVIEKHFTLDRDMEGPDHKASLEPDELKKMVEAIRNIELAKGDGVKRVTESEVLNRNVARKSIVAKRPISKGEVITEENVTTKRPGNGISPMQWYEVIGTKAIRNFKEDELIEI